jgi:chitinase
LIFAAITLACAAVALYAASASPGAARANIFGYYCVYCQHQGRNPGKPFTPKDIATSGAADQLAAIYYAFEHVDDNRCQLFFPTVDLDEPYAADASVDGTADPDGPGHLRGVFHQLQELKQKYPHLKMIVSLGGWGLSGGFSSAAEPENVHAFVSSCVDIFIRGDFAPGVSAPGIFDGIDIDWEYPVSGGTAPGRPEDTHDLTAMAQEFRRQLDAVRPGLWLTAALPGTEHDFNKFDLKPLSRSMNDLAIMAYDMASANDPTRSFASALFRDPTNPAGGNNYGDYAVQAFLRAGVPGQKIVLGVPFGGARHWSGVSDVNHGLYQPVTPKPAAVNSSVGAASANPAAASSSTSAGATASANAAPGRGGVDSLPADADRQYWPGAGSCSVWYDNNFWSYDCAQAMSAKAAYVRSHHLGGVMFWELSHDAGGALLRALSGQSPTN